MSKTGNHWIAVGNLEDIPRRGARVVKTGEGDIAVFRSHDDHVFAVHDSCPHKGGPLSQGIMYGHKVACPLHNWVIDLESGNAVAPDTGCTRRYQIRVESGVIYLELKQLAKTPSAHTSEVA